MRLLNVLMALAIGVLALFLLTGCHSNAATQAKQGTAQITVDAQGIKDHADASQQKTEAARKLIADVIASNKNLPADVVTKLKQAVTYLLGSEDDDKVISSKAANIVTTVPRVNGNIDSLSDQANNAKQMFWIKITILGIIGGGIMFAMYMGDVRLIWAVAAGGGAMIGALSLMGVVDQITHWALIVGGVLLVGFAIYEFIQFKDGKAVLFRSVAKKILQEKKAATTNAA